HRRRRLAPLPPPFSSAPMLRHVVYASLLHFEVETAAGLMTGGGYKGPDNLAGTMARINDPAPVILLAHEPTIFRRVPERVSLTLCGHTHGGQVNLPIFTNRMMRSHFGFDLIYGHIVERGRHLIISAGLRT